MKGLFKSLVWQAFQPTSRYFNSSAARWGVDKALLSKLRKQTGIPFISCKKALEKHDNNFDEAKTWLLEEAQKAGWARATKLQSRPMSQGLVAVIGDSRQVTILEINCETDFVSKNEKFRAMVEQLAEDCSVHFEQQAEKMVVASKEDLGQIKSRSAGTLADMIAVNLGNLGENMALRRGSFLRADDNSELACYVHPSAPGNTQTRLQVGKYGVVVELSRQSKDLDRPVMPINQLGHHLCQHIVGMNPKIIGEFSASTDRTAAASDQSRDIEDKPEQGEDQADQDEAEQDEAEQDEESLLNQEFLLDNTILVGDLLAVNGTEVKTFTRFACGEELPGDQ